MVKHTVGCGSLSSAEAELTGLCKGGAQATGLQSFCADRDLTLKLRLHRDSTAAIGVCKRRGLGKIRHLAVADLWLQDKVRSGDLTIHEVLGADNPADAMTKVVGRSTLEMALNRVSMQPEGGRAASAAKIS